MIILTRKGFRGRRLERARRDALTPRAWAYSHHINEDPSFEIDLDGSNGDRYTVRLTRRDVEVLNEAMKLHT